MTHRSNSQPSTKLLFPRIAVVSDFDDSLAPDSVSSLLDGLSVDTDEFWSERVQPLVNDGWDPISAVFYQMVQLSRAEKNPSRKITRKKLAEHGRTLELFNGAAELFDRLRNRARELDPQVEVVFYIVSCGIGDIIRSSPIAGQFRAVWASEFHFDDTGEIDFVKRVISHTEKTRYLYQVAKGQDSTSNQMGQAFDLHRRIPPEKLCVPLSQIIYVGDGLTDVPCFSVVNQEKGVAPGLYKDSTPRKWGKQVTIRPGQRVSNLAEADFREGSELMRSLLLALESICKQIALRELSVEE